MSNLFDSPFSHDSNFVEASVTNVDPIRYICSVRTLRGQFFTEVPWLSSSGGSGKNGFHSSPSVGDQVVVFTGLTYPIIMGCLPRLGPPSTTLTNATGELLGTDVGNSTNMKNGFVTNPAKPSDFVPGDQVMTSEGGGVLALLKNGTVLMKASGLAQILISKFDDIVRVVARNYERFSDIGQHTVANVKGRMYEFMGWDRRLDRAKVGLYELKELIGDVTAGEVLLGEPNTTETLPAADTRVRKFWLENHGNDTYMVEILEQSGKITVTVQDTPKTTKTVTQHDKDLFDTKVENPSTWSQVTIIPGSVNVRTEGGGVYSQATLVPQTITFTQNGQATTVMDGAGIRSTFSSHFVNIDSSGVHMG